MILVTDMPRCYYHSSKIVSSSKYPKRAALGCGTISREELRQFSNNLKQTIEFNKHEHLQIYQ